MVDKNKKLKLSEYYHIFILIIVPSYLIIGLINFLVKNPWYFEQQKKVLRYIISWGYYGL